ncbi:UNVERIFIED_CONTAM: hypothetical protein K2H54_020454 [Gekko kuhli]
MEASRVRLRARLVQRPVSKNDQPDALKCLSCQIPITPSSHCFALALHPGLCVHCAFFKKKSKFLIKNGEFPGRCALCKLSMFVCERLRTADPAKLHFVRRQ